MNNNVLVGPLLGSIAPVVIALIAAGVYIGSLGETISTLEEEVKKLEETSEALTTQLGSLTDKVSAMETPEPTPTRGSSRTTPSVGPAPGSQINFSNSAPWGGWSDPLYCPEGQYVYGLRQKVEPHQGKGDDTAMNAMAFYCRPLP